MVLFMSMWPEIDEYFAKKQKLPPQIKLSSEQLVRFYEKKEELDQIISDTQIQLQNLTELNVELNKKLGSNGGPPPKKEREENKKGNPSTKIIQGLKQKISQKDLEIIKLMGEKNEKLKQITKLKEELEKSKNNKGFEDNSVPAPTSSSALTKPASKPPLTPVMDTSNIDTKKELNRLQLEIKLSHEKYEDMHQKYLSAQNHKKTEDKELKLLKDGWNTRFLQKETEIQELKEANTKLHEKVQDLVGIIGMNKPESSTETPSITTTGGGQDHGNLDEDFERIQLQLADSFQENDQLEGLLNQAKQTISQLESQAQDLNKENQDLISELNEIQTQNKTLVDENSQIEKSFKIMTENFKSMSKKYQTLQAVIKEKYERMTSVAERTKFQEKAEKIVQEAERDISSAPSLKSPSSSQTISSAATQIIKPAQSIGRSSPSPPLGSTASPSSLKSTTPPPPSKKLATNIASSNLSVPPMMGQRIVCPHCGATGRKIKIQEDKSQIISYIPQILYKKVYACSQCGHKF